MTRSKAFFTLSFLIKSEVLDKRLQNVLASTTDAVWTHDLLKKLQTSYAGSGKLHAAIDPMFEDISDRSRNLFIKDFLLDTPNGYSPTSSQLSETESNTCAIVTLKLDGQLHWQTEGRNRVSIDLGQEGVVFTDVVCRAFWMAHSNHTLSYHLSLEVPFCESLRDYFGLGMLQKLFFPSENTEWLIDGVENDGGANGKHDVGWMVKEAGSKNYDRFLLFVENQFESHIRHLFNAIAWIKSNPNNALHMGVFPESASADNFSIGAWKSLVLGDVGNRSGPGTTSAQWISSSRSRRLLVLFRSEAFFNTLERAQKEVDLFSKFSEISPENGIYDIDHIESCLRAQFLVPNSHAQNEFDAIKPYGIGLFLSGFFQNIIDFLKQDGLEVHDGLAPIYPTDGALEANKGYLLYASNSVIYEVVRKSRSLDGAGAQWIGTCPYLFLVHMTAFHNESLVHAYEVKVSNLVLDLEAQGLSSQSRRKKDYEGIFEKASRLIKDFQLVTFKDVHKHYSFNIFRYETERTFFSTIQEVRGIEQRREYWDKVLSHLTETVDSFRDESRNSFEKKLNIFGLVLAVSGVLQVWFAVFPLIGKADDLIIQPPTSLLGAIGLFTAIIAVFLYVYLPGTIRPVINLFSIIKKRLRG